MKFWTFSTSVIAALLVSVASAAQPNQDDAKANEPNAIASPDSAVVKLSADGFKEFLDENPLVLAEFFAPWCGYCKQLGPEFSKAADELAKSHPSIKLAQVDCTEEQQLCQQQGIKGYPTMKVIRGAYQQPTDYEGPRDAEGIVSHMIKMSLPPVQIVDDVAKFVADGNAEAKPYVVQILPTAAHKESKWNETFSEYASIERNSNSFYSLEDDDVIAAFGKEINVDISGDEPKYLVIHPRSLDDVRLFDGEEFLKDTFKDWVSNAQVPAFGDINGSTYVIYMGSTLPLGYYFYNTAEERQLMTEFFETKGKELRGKINFVALDATKFGRHAEVLNMDPEVVPLFAVQDNANGRKYGISQTEHPVLSTEIIETFLEKFLAGEVNPIIKSEPEPTEEEVASRDVTKLVASTYNDVLSDLSKDIFVEYFAPWCGHCKKLAPIWEELAGLFKNTDVLIADVDHTLNDVDTPFVIEGYPTIIFYPANGEIDAKTGVRSGVVYTGDRLLEGFLKFIDKKAASENKEPVEPEVVEEVEDLAEADAPEELEAAEPEVAEHDEL